MNDILVYSRFYTRHCIQNKFNSIYFYDVILFLNL